MPGPDPINMDFSSITDREGTVIQLLLIIARTLVLALPGTTPAGQINGLMNRLQDITNRVGNKGV